MQREGDGGGSKKKKKEAGRKRALGMESGILEKHGPCKGSAVKDSSDTVSPADW